MCKRSKGSGGLHHCTGSPEPIVVAIRYSYLCAVGHLCDKYHHLILVHTAFVLPTSSLELLLGAYVISHSLTLAHLSLCLSPIVAIRYSNVCAVGRSPLW